MPKILGISSSLRNARWGLGSSVLINTLKDIKDEDGLYAFLKNQSDIHIENFIKAGRNRKDPFISIYCNLKKQKGDRGLSNSEVALTAALWAIQKKGVEIEHLSLSEFFQFTGKQVNIDYLKERLIKADAILLSGPVYFGDRGSLAQELISLIRSDGKLRRILKGKLYGGISVGAKRNGGQETTLIYQILDMVSLGFLAVGNDSDTTAQYGGTCHAGDIGTMYKDKYGLDTSKGTGRRLANLLINLHQKKELRGVPKVLFLLLQDTNDLAKRNIYDLIERCSSSMKASVLDLKIDNIYRCIACDICPKEIGVDEVYRCIIGAKNDAFSKYHNILLNSDAIVPVAASVHDYSSVKTVYQLFIERTRYLRRGDYALSDRLTAPLVFEEIGASEFLSLRMITSLIRHHLVISKPMIGYIHKGKVLNSEQLIVELEEFCKNAARITEARLSSGFSSKKETRYLPVGYILGSEKENDEKIIKKRENMVESRIQKMKSEAMQRLII